MKTKNYFDNSNVFIVAELSANHNGSLNIAIETIKAAAKIGVDAVKLQTYTADTMTINSTKEDFIIKNKSIWDGQNFYNLYKKAYTPWEWHEKLFRVANEEGIICFSTPFDKSSVDFLEELDNPIYKIASFEINDIPLIEYVASKGKPVILSAGIAEKEEIKLAIETIRNIGNNDISLLKCTSSYPAPIHESNLIMIEKYKNEFKVTPGLSDHSPGIIAPVVATILGAKIIEKHIILDKSIGGPDAPFSLDINQFSEMIKSIRDAESAVGEVSYDLTEKQISGRVFSRSLYVVKDIKKGEFFSQNNIKSIRPGLGLHPKFLKNFLGKKAKENIKAGERLDWNLIIDSPCKS